MRVEVAVEDHKAGSPTDDFLRALPASQMASVAGRYADKVRCSSHSLVCHANLKSKWLLSVSTAQMRKRGSSVIIDEDFTFLGRHKLVLSSSPLRTLKLREQRHHTTMLFVFPAVLMKR